MIRGAVTVCVLTWSEEIILNFIALKSTGYGFTTFLKITVVLRSL